jgi:tetratricopeptide (TPR) repeat protein
MNRIKIRSSISVVMITLLMIILSMPSVGQTSQFRHKVDKSAILLQFQKQLFKPLNSKLEEFQQAFEEDYQAEDCVFDAFKAFKKADFAYEPLLQSWVTQFPNSFAPFVARAEYYCACALKARGNKRVIEKDQNEYKEMERYYLLALLDIDQALKLNVQLDVCYAMKIEIGMELGTEELITNSLVEASKYHPYGYSVKLKYVQTMTPRKGGSYEKMEGFIRSYEKMAVYNPKIKELSASISAEKGNTFFYLGKYDQAVMMYTEALKYSQYHSYYADRGDAYTRLQKYKLAFADYDQALELSPQDPEYLQRKAQAVSFQNRSSKIQSVQRNSEQSDRYEDWPPKKSSMSEMKESHEHSQKGFEFSRAGKYNEAITEYTEAIRLSPNNDALFYNRGLCYINTNNGDAAIQDFNKSIEFNGNNIDAYIQITTIYANRGMYDDALNSINTVISLQPDNAEAYYDRGKIYDKKGMNYEAVEDIRKACEMGYQRACREYKINK